MLADVLGFLQAYAAPIAASGAVVALVVGVWLALRAWRLREVERQPVSTSKSENLYILDSVVSSESGEESDQKTKELLARAGDEGKRKERKRELPEKADGTDRPKGFFMASFAGRPKRIVPDSFAGDDILAAIQSAPGDFAEEVRGYSALEVHSGKLVERIPRMMRVGKREQIEVRLGADGTPKLAMGLVGSGELVEHDLPIVETMAVDLYSPDDCFLIEPKSDREQLIKKDALRGTPLAALTDDYGRWMWSVTPQKVGKKKLALRVSARVLDSNGWPTPHTLVPDRDIEIDVKVNKSALAWKGLLWVAGSILAAALAYFNEVIRAVAWPILNNIMRSLFGFGV